jgi:hypothetical protein
MAEHVAHLQKKMKNGLIIFVGKLQESLSLNWEDNIKVDCRGIECKRITEFSLFLVGSTSGACELFCGPSLSIRKGISFEGD